MKSMFALVVLAVLGTAGISLGVTLWTGPTGHQDSALRAIHYDTQYDLSAQRRAPVR
ncbi:MAG: hypothetical protein WCG92_04625 [Hyphomicrobiales bacterium]|nr:hypothetical protein [Alphaproteobacteria bacterium]